MDKQLMFDMERAVENNQMMMATTLLLNAIKELDDRLEELEQRTTTAKKATAKKATRSSTKATSDEDEQDK